MRFILVFMVMYFFVIIMDCYLGIKYVFCYNVLVIKYRVIVILVLIWSFLIFLLLIQFVWINYGCDDVDEEDEDFIKYEICYDVINFVFYVVILFVVMIIVYINIFIEILC